MSHTANGKYIILTLLPLGLSAAALFATVWIVVRAFAYQIWLLSVLTSEWSLGFGALALLALVLNCFARVKSRLSFLIWLCGGVAAAISLYPPISALRAAREQNVSLSLTRYISGFWRDSNFSFAAAEPEFETRVFARINDLDLRLDVYAPRAKAANGAGVIVVHGGSWSGGARSDFLAWNRWLANQGYTVFDIDYRLTQPNWQTATNDVKCAVGWIKDRADEFRIAPDKLALMGRSAGGHLALLAAYTANNDEFASSCPNQQNPAVAAVISFYAPTDLLWAFDHPANKRVINGPAVLSAFLGGSPDDSNEMRARYAAASPVAQVSPASPPTLLVHGSQDQLVLPQNLEFLDKQLNAVNVPHKTITINYAQHGFDFNFNGWGSQIVQPAMLDFLEQNLRPDSSAQNESFAAK